MTHDLNHAHTFCTSNRNSLSSDTLCGCFFCITIFEPKEIEQWLDMEHTAICPHCGIDSIIGKYSGFPITEEFLRQMQEVWFNTLSTDQI
ncbi:MAG: cytoplasmic protein [Oscillospiraceae bacterium]|nr:cytoplasmic protein [Oscillospiraceae bacterium]